MTQCSPDNCARLAASVAAELDPKIRSILTTELAPLRSEVDRLHGRFDGLAEAGAFRRSTRPSSGRDWKGIGYMFVAMATAVAIIAGIVRGADPPKTPEVAHSADGR